MIRHAGGYAVPLKGADWGSAELFDLLRALISGPQRTSGLTGNVDSWFHAQFGRSVQFFNSGRSALETALLRLRANVRSGGTIAVPSFICEAVPSKIVKCGFRPIFYDMT